MKAKHAAIIRLGITDVRMPGAITHRLTLDTLSRGDRALYVRAARRTIDRAITEAFEALRDTTQRLHDHLKG